jgi:glycosyltransferase involved in cell wall biosynthesis
VISVAISSVGRPADDPHAWSGIPSSVLRALDARTDVETVVLAPPARAVHLAGRVASFVTKRLPGDHKVNWEVERAVVRPMTRDVIRQVRRDAPTSVLLAAGWLPLATGREGRRIAFYNDCVYGQQVGVSPHFSGLGRHTRRVLERVEGEAFRNLGAIVMASKWAANDAIRRYGVDPARVHVVPFAANIATPAEVHRHAPDGPLRLLVVGVEWLRKGVDVAIGATDALQARGYDAQLDVVGVLPPDDSWRRDYVRFHGFLSKADPTQFAEFERLLTDAHVLLFPSREEPFGIAPIEAAAYSLPVVAPALNALPEIVENGRTGTLVAAGSGGDAYADAVVELVSDEARYEAMCIAARRNHVERLNWTRSVDLLTDILREL